MAESPIRNYLNSLPRNEPLYFFANPGNAGDALIALATYRLFRELGIDYRSVNVSQPFDPSGKIMLYGGGGNLVEHYHTARNVIGKYYPYLRKLVILPHTIDANEDLLAEFRANADIICREPISYAHVRRCAPRANVLLMDDMAFNLDTENILQTKTRVMTYFKDPRIRAWILRDFLIDILLPVRQIPGKISRQRDWMTLNSFRKDIESTHRNLPRDNVDLASLFGHGTDNEAISFYGPIVF